MSAKPDLWGDLQVSELRTPVAILREQAALLGPKTKNLIEARVETIAGQGGFSHAFKLVVPALDGYEYQLFRVRHGINAYPVDEPDSFDPPLASEKEFTSWLQQTLSSDRTKRIVSQLLAQVQATQP